MQGDSTACLCGCGSAVRPGRQYIVGHSLRGPKTEAHKAAISAALTAYYAKQPRTHKRCPRCGDTKPAEHFGLRSKLGASGQPLLKSLCRPCEREQAQAFYQQNRLDSAAHRVHHLRWKYNLTPVDYDRMLAEQGGVCAICGTTQPSRRTKHFNIDHCHKTGRIRGLLCESCNIGIGKLGDDPVRVAAALRYLETS